MNPTSVSPMPKKFAVLVVALLASASRIYCAETLEQTPTSDWSFNVSPYLWVAAVKVETTLDNSPPSSGDPASDDKYETKLGGGALLAGQLRYKSVGLWVDFVWIQTDTNAIAPGPFFSGKHLETNFYHSTVAASYLLPTSGNFHVELLAGARYWSVDATVATQAGLLPAASVGHKETWVTPVVGIDFGYDINDKWSFIAKGTAAIGNHNSDGWEVMGGATYRFGSHWSTTLAYRYLREEYERNYFAYFTNVSGVVLGASYRF
jgi:opacity protein-like surface antigen